MPANVGQRVVPRYKKLGCLGAEVNFRGLLSSEGSQSDSHIVGFISRANPPTRVCASKNHAAFIEKTQDLPYHVEERAKFV